MKYCVKYPVNVKMKQKQHNHNYDYNTNTIVYVYLYYVLFLFVQLVKLLYCTQMLFSASAYIGFALLSCGHAATFPYFCSVSARTKKVVELLDHIAFVKRTRTSLVTGERSLSEHRVSLWWQPQGYVFSTFS